MSGTKVSFDIKPSVYIYKKRKYMTYPENESPKEDTWEYTYTYEPETQPNQIEQPDHTKQTTVPEVQFSRPSLTIKIPNPGAYRPLSKSPPPSVSPETTAIIVQEAIANKPLEVISRKVENTVRKEALALAHNYFLQSDTPHSHITSFSEKTPSTFKSPPQHFQGVSPLQLSPLANSPIKGMAFPKPLPVRSLSSERLDWLTERPTQ